MSKIYVYAFIQEIQEALDEQQNTIDSLVSHNQINNPLAQPFAFESQIDSDTYPVNLSLKSTDELIHPTNESENNILNETIPILAAPNNKKQSETDHQSRQQKSSWTSTKDSFHIKKEPITPVMRVCFVLFEFSLYLYLAKNKTTSIENSIEIKTKKFIISIFHASNDHDTII